MFFCWSHFYLGPFNKPWALRLNVHELSLKRIKITFTSIACKFYSHFSTTGCSSLTKWHICFLVTTAWIGIFNFSFSFGIIDKYLWHSPSMWLQHIYVIYTWMCLCVHNISTYSHYTVDCVYVRILLDFFRKRRVKLKV
jgi:hypothetical protein